MPSDNHIPKILIPSYFKEPLNIPLSKRGAGGILSMFLISDCVSISHGIENTLVDIVELNPIQWAADSTPSLFDDMGLDHRCIHILMT